MATVRNSVKKREAVTPSANPLPSGACGCIWLTEETTVSGTLVGGSTITAITYPAKQWIPESFSVTSTVTAGTCYAGYTGGKAG